MILVRVITYFGQPAALACDGNCAKAWGINNRPRIIIDEDEDDYIWLADDAVGIAPDDPGTYEGLEACGKPQEPADRLNKWCARECERSVIGDRYQTLYDGIDFSRDTFREALEEIIAEDNAHHVLYGKHLLHDSVTNKAKQALADLDDD
jgi:hypothetical protein